MPPLFFQPYLQNADIGALHMYVRTAGDPDATMDTIAKAVADLDPNLPIEDLRTLPQQLRENMYMDRFIGVLSTAFASLATLLAAIGLYGVLAYSVSLRTREIGLRMALGAAPSRVRGMVLRDVAFMTLVGGAVGLAAALGIGRFAASLLFQVSADDPVVLVASAGTLIAVALAAGAIPARRASRIDPMRALRYL